MASTDTPQTGPEFWEARYSGDGFGWSGNVNDLLAPEAERLTPGRALDLGCGTGGDAIWFAKHGWQVTAVDISHAAIAQAKEHAAEAGVAGAISFERHDFEESFPAGEFDLVSACYLQSPVEFARLEALKAAAAAVAPGGTLVVVSHESTPAGPDSGHPPTYMPTAPQLWDDLALDAERWELVKAEPVARKRERDGKAFEYRDNVLRARRR